MNIKDYSNAYSAVIKNRSQGFTLAELLVVVAIIAILVAISIPIITGKLDAAREATCKSNCRSLKAEISVALLSGDGVPGLVGTSISNDNLRANYGDDFDFDSFCPSKGQISAEVTDASGDGTGTVHVYCSEHNPKQPVYDAWVSGKSYAIGDLMTSGEYNFICLRAHTSGDGQYTRDPATKSNKGTWEVIGTVDGSTLKYDSVVRYSAGFRVTYTGNIYERTNYNLSGGALPTNTDYWKLVE